MIPRGLRPIVLIILLIQVSNYAMSQILAPDLNCVKNDTLFWSNVNNSCGPFISYDIYVSSSIDGPYNLLTSINSELTEFFEHINPSGDPLYYYMLGNYNCPGLVSLHSDTVSNQLLSPIKIKQVSIENGFAEISWYPSTNSEINTYIIYKSTNLGTVPIDTVYNNTTYVDLLSEVSNKTESYFVISLNECGETSPFDLPHTSVLIESSVDPCARHIQITWNPYNSWLNDIENQFLWVSINNGPELQVGNLSSSSNTAIIPNVDEFLSYCFRIEAHETSTNAFSSSNTICIQPDVVQPMKNIQITNLSVNQTNQLVLSWQWDDNAELSFANILQGTNALPGEIFKSIDHNNLIANNEVEISVNPSSAYYSYEIITQDQCDSTKSSGVAKACRLFVSQQLDGSHFLYWSGFSIPNANIISYDIYRDEGLGPQIISTNVASDTFFIDQGLDIDPNISAYCYKIGVNFSLEMADGSILQNTAFSNEKCILEEVEIWFPNAFVPDGVNQVFKPVIKHQTSISTFQMVVYDRWGKQIFESNSPENGWNGYRDGRIMMPGVYTYQAVIRQENGKQIRKNGQILLIR